MTLQEIASDPLLFDLLGSFALAMIIFLLLPEIMRYLPYVVAAALLVLAIYTLYLL